MTFWGKSIAKQLSLNSTVSKNSKSKKSDQKEEEDFTSVISSSGSKPPVPPNKERTVVDQPQDRLPVGGKERRRSNNSGSTARSTVKSVSHGLSKYATSDGNESSISREYKSGGSHIPLRKAEVKVPVSAAHVLMHQRDALTDFEQSEILQYQNIYYWGQNVKKDKKIKSDPKAPHNNGYDDARADLIAIKNDHLAYRYEVLEVMGRGSFGQVMRCFDHKSKTMRAVKVIRNRRRFKNQAAQEIRMLEKLATRGDVTEANNLVRKLGHFQFRGHLCISFELLSYNLYEVLRKESFIGMAPGLVRKICQQVLECLRYLGQNNVIHCDLKPENILLKSPGRPGSVKVVDFGSSCFEDERVFTYIQSRFYRAPEVILGLPYSAKIDMWSLGCLLAELHNGFPLFPGENEPEQLMCIMEVLGVPPDNLITTSPRRKLFFDSDNQPRSVPAQRGGRRRVPGTKNLKDVLKGTDPLFIDFLSRCLKWDASERMTHEQALEHPWISQHRSGGSMSPRYMPTSSKPITHTQTSGLYTSRSWLANTNSGQMQRQPTTDSLVENLAGTSNASQPRRSRDAGDGIARTLAGQQSGFYASPNTGVVSARNLKGVNNMNNSFMGSQTSNGGSTSRGLAHMSTRTTLRRELDQKSISQQLTTKSALVRNFSLASRELEESQSHELVGNSSGTNNSRGTSKKTFFPSLFQRNSKN